MGLVATKPTVAVLTSLARSLLCSRMFCWFSAVHFSFWYRVLYVRTYVVCCSACAVTNWFRKQCAVVYLSGARSLPREDKSHLTPHSPPLSPPSAMSDSETAGRPVSPHATANTVSSVNSSGSTAPVTLNVGSPSQAGGADSGKEEKKTADAQPLQPTEAFMNAVLGRLSLSISAMLDSAVQRAMAPLQQQQRLVAERLQRVEQPGEEQHRGQTAADVQATPTSLRQPSTQRSLAPVLEERTPAQQRSQHTASGEAVEELLYEEEDSHRPRGGQQLDSGAEPLSTEERKQLRESMAMVKNCNVPVYHADTEADKDMTVMDVRTYVVCCGACAVTGRAGQPVRQVRPPLPPRPAGEQPGHRHDAGREVQHHHL